MADVKKKPSLLDVDTVDQNHDALVQQAEAALPPPGHERDEVLRARQDTLEEAAETLANETGAFKVDERILEPDREIRFQLASSASSIPNAQNEYDYKYEYTGNGGLQINMSKSLVVSTNRGPMPIGWQIVDRSMPEARGMEELIDVNGHIRLGDTILMRRLKDRSELEARYQEWVRARQAGESTDAVREMDEKNKRNNKTRNAIKLLDEEQAEDWIAFIQKRAPGYKESARELYARMGAQQQLDKMLKDGTVLGLGVGQ